MSAALQHFDNPSSVKMPPDTHEPCQTGCLLKCLCFMVELWQLTHTHPVTFHQPNITQCHCLDQDTIYVSHYHIKISTGFSITGYDISTVNMMSAMKLSATVNTVYLRTFLPATRAAICGEIMLSA